MTDKFVRSEPPSQVGRRDLLRWGVAAAGVAALFDPADALAGRFSVARQVKLHNLNTGESLNAEYWVRGRYLPDALRAIDWILRDHRTDELCRMSPQLLDLLAALHLKADAGQPFEVICGYRSASTNAMMRASGRRGVARNSLHTQGKAIDINLPGASLVHLCRTARSMQAGGVGYYPRSNFVHVDIGPVRHW